MHINKKQNIKQSIVLHIFNAFTFHAQGTLISFQSTTESLEMHVLTALPLSTDAGFTQETCSLISDSEKSMWHAAYMGFIDPIGWRPHRSIQMISTSIEHPSLSIHMTADPAYALCIPEGVGERKVDFIMI